MKKKKLTLSKKLLLQKASILDLNKQQQASLAGGQETSDCTWDPQDTCVSRPRPGVVCM
ncbi:class I lanthipeptide [Chitinophaga nivalis]|uniref:Class I lanthipeptide n=1 Tax=Chitinophaga nivalis TaxID=2991709 RepID=A0ABT3IJI2_9BACT|nr:class I lanthipeptide [Chitinophaga nivalis]MCW3466210.1 class I lanthipeptide [Chitinophaga nivalis]MCW3484099.1 class I lanthipeptide [Chitinophaga nivalis]